MSNKRLLFIVVLALIVVAIFGFIFLRQHEKKPTTDSSDELSDCLKLKTGNVFLKVDYPNSFTNAEYPGIIRLHKIGENAFVLAVDISYYRSIDQILEEALLEPGPKYERVVFNGYDAGYYKHLTDSGDIIVFYSVPYGHNEFTITYQPTLLSNKEQVLAQKMLDSITFIETDENVKISRVENCQN